MKTLYLSNAHFVNDVLYRMVGNISSIVALKVRAREFCPKDLPHVLLAFNIYIAYEAQSNSILLNN